MSKVTIIFSKITGRPDKCIIKINDKNYTFRNERIIKELYNDLVSYQIPCKRIRKEEKVVIKFFDVNNSLEAIIKENSERRKLLGKKVNKNQIINGVLVASMSSLLFISTFIHKENNKQKTVLDTQNKDFSIITEYEGEDDDFDVVETIETYAATPVVAPMSTMNIPITKEDIVKEEQEEETPTQVVDGTTSTLELEYEDRSNSTTAAITKGLYADLITKYANMYGLPSDLMIALATQEGQVHQEEVSPGGAIGLMQLQVEGSWNWTGKTISVFNYDTNQTETITIGMDENGEINQDLLKDLEKNIWYGCAIAAYDLAYCNGDLALALQTYNSGPSAKNLKDTYGDDWLNYRSSLPGDPLYLEHVLSYVSKENSNLYYKIDQKTNLLEVKNLEEEKVQTM